MPSTQEVLQGLGKAELERLKALDTGIKIHRVIGPRVLVKTVMAYTDMDRVEKEGLLHIPDEVKKRNTPMESSGVVVAMGSTALEDPMNFDAEGNHIVTEGAMIAFSKYAGQGITADHEDFRIIELREILCTLSDTKGAVVPVKDPGLLELA